MCIQSIFIFRMFDEGSVRFEGISVQINSRRLSGKNLISTRYCFEMSVHELRMMHFACDKIPIELLFKVKYPFDTISVWHRKNSAEKRGMKRILIDSLWGRQCTLFEKLCLLSRVWVVHWFWSFTFAFTFTAKIANGVQFIRSKIWKDPFQFTFIENMNDRSVYRSKSK